MLYDDVAHVTLVFTGLEALGCSEHCVPVQSVFRTPQRPSQALRKPPGSTGQTMLHVLIYMFVY